MRTIHVDNYLRMGVACAAVVLLGALATSRTHADEDGSDHEGDAARIRRGFEIAPVPLNLKHRDRDLVGLGSYLVNAVADCNGCHSAGPVTEYAPGGNPYFKGSPPTVVTLGSDQRCALQKNMWEEDV